ncbi:MAG: competence/damage-inducible protein A [Sandaracinaceae bacterium]|nr:competence/damage-inducible protein A [Sandaracinaceae bacterium]
MPRTAAALIIGNEILTGKIREANVYVLAREMRLLGVNLRRVVVCSDEIDVIAYDLNALREAHDFVFTSGGVGPTHDDVTLAAVATSFERPLVRCAEIEELLRGYWGDRITQEHLRMATMPEGARLLTNDEIRWPVIAIGNVYVLPGVPQIFEAKLRLLREEIGAATPYVSRALFTSADEGAIASLLEAVEAAYPSVAIGSYPRWRDERYKVKVTFDGLDPRAVDDALASCRAAIGEDRVVAVE